MRRSKSSRGLAMIDDLLADGIASFSFKEAHRRSRRSRADASDLLRWLVEHGLIDRVRRGHYVIRQIGVLGTRAAAEDVALAVAAAFDSQPHRIAYRSALDEHDFLTHPSRTIQVATSRRFRMRVGALSGRPLRIILEPETAVSVGAVPRGNSWLSDRERALLDAAHRPQLVGGAAVLAEALVAAGEQTCPRRMMQYAQTLHWTAALRRIGSLADALGIDAIAGKLSPLKTPKGDIDLEPGGIRKTVWRDSAWWVRWAVSLEDIANVTYQ